MEGEGGGYAEGASGGQTNSELKTEKGRRRFSQFKIRLHFSCNFVDCYFSSLLVTRGGDSTRWELASAVGPARLLEDSVGCLELSYERRGSGRRRSREKKNARNKTSTIRRLVKMTPMNMLVDALETKL